jgi:hypothetical protein
MGYGNKKWTRWALLRSRLTLVIFIAGIICLGKIGLLPYDRKNRRNILPELLRGESRTKPNLGVRS